MRLELPEGRAVRLPDGRAIGLVETGVPSGRPVFFFHGFPGSRLESVTLANAAASAGVRLIGLDRPGVGLSSPRLSFGFPDWPADVAGLADQLGIAEFAVLGFSGGAPFAIACALSLADRVRACGLLSSALPVAFIRGAARVPAALFWLAVEWTPTPLLGHLVDFAMGDVPRVGEDEIDRRLVRRARSQGPADEAALADPVFRRILAMAVVESYRQGTGANRNLARLLTRRWPFAVGAVSGPAMFLWHGEQDRVMPAAGARRLAAAIPASRATFLRDEGHLSPLANRGAEILSTLAAQ